MAASIQLPGFAFLISPRGASGPLAGSRSRYRTSLAGFITALLLATSANAATLTVTSGADAGGTCPGADCTLRQAIATAAAGDTINFAAGIGEITLTSGELTIAQDVTIDGGDSKIFVCSGGTFPVFNIIDGTVAISRLTICGGRAANGIAGGGIRNDGVLRLSQTTLAGNQGGLWNRVGATARVDNCTVVNTFGGGACIRNEGTLTLTNSTVVGNSSGIAIGVENTGTARVLSCIIARNHTNSLPRDVTGNFISDGYNFIGIKDDSTGFGNAGSFDQCGTESSPLDPKLYGWGDNGGVTKTMRPMAGSPVIDAGNRGVDINGQPLNTDQRGLPRPVDQPGIDPGDSSDIGAVEQGPPQPGPTFTVTNTGEHDDGNGGCTNDDCTLREAVNASNASAVASTINFAAGVTGTITTKLTPQGLLITKPVTINGPGARNLTISAENSGGVFIINGSNVAMSGLTIANGMRSVANAGAAVYHSSGTLTLTDCTIRDNTTTSGSGSLGAGIYNLTGCTLELTRCTLSGNNNVDQPGGAIYNLGILTATNCTFTGNTATAGGAIICIAAADGSMRATLRNCTITGNTATSTSNGSQDGGGGFYGQGGAGNIYYHFSNTIIAGNTNSINPDVRGNFNSDGHNLIGAPGNSTGFSNEVNGDQVGVNPMLDTSLKNNGGPTDTVALLSDSTAINAGDDALDPQTDQRGFSRNGTSDIGAFEFGATPGAPPSVTTGPATDITSTTVTLNATVNPNGLATSFYFTSDFQAFALQDAGNGNTVVPFSVTVTDLSPNTVYHYNAAAVSAAGSTQGVEQTFTTLPVPTTLANISTRLRVQGGDNVLIGGMIATGTVGKTVIIRAIGPTLTDFGVPGALTDPTLELFQGNTLIASNDDWRLSPQQAEISNSGLAPGKDAESAIIATLTPNQNYTAIVRGKDGQPGVGLVEVFDLDQSAPAKLGNISTRGFVDVDDNVMIAGLIVGPSGGTNTKVLVRALGPTLGDFGVADALANPTLDLVNSSGTVIRSSDNWQSDQGAQIQASGLAPAHIEEAALIETLIPGAYTAIVRGSGRTTGVGLVEVYNIP